MEKTRDEREIQGWLINEISKLIGAERSSIGIHKPFADYGLSSIDVVSLSGALEEFIGRRLSPTLAYEYPNIYKLAKHLSGTSRSDSVDSSRYNNSETDSIAIIGMACRFPGAKTIDEFWELLKNGEDRISEVPKDRWKSDQYYHPDPSMPGKSVSNWGGFIDGVDQFDPSFFGISPKEAKDMDPQQRLLLELSFEALDDAGLNIEQISGTNTGVFVGVSVNEYSQLQLEDPLKISNLSGTGSALSIAANRVSYFYDLHGPSMVVDTACSSSLSAFHLACKSLRSGECDMALIGGVNLIFSPTHSIAFTKAGVLSADGRCKTFDNRADGYVRGEGGGFLVLKSLSNALENGDNIYSVSRGSVMFQDGRTNGLMAPNKASQEKMLSEAYMKLGIDPKRVQYVEAHGTGTLLGDSIEANAIGNILGKDRLKGKCHIGSVKSNIGHLEAAAGMAGLIKVALCIKNKYLVPSINFKEPNQYVSFDNLNLQVQDRFSPWPDPTNLLIAGVSSFGFGGTNVHAVLEAAESSTRQREDLFQESGSTFNDLIFPISGRDSGNLLVQAKGMRNFMKSQTEYSMIEVCHAAGIRRSNDNFRLAVLGDNKKAVLSSLDHFVRGVPDPNVLTGRQTNMLPKVAFVFSGQGGQWFSMGKELIESEPVFYQSIKEINTLIIEFYGWSVTDFLMDKTEFSEVEQINKIQPAIFAIQISLVKLLSSWGISADAVVGHSMGEVAAAYVSGALNLEDAIQVICSRSELLTSLEGRGCMMVTELTPDEASKVLMGYVDEISIAAINGPKSTVLSGDHTKMIEIKATLEANNLYCKLVKVNVASHSPQIELLKQEMIEGLDGIYSKRSQIPIYSTVTGDQSKEGIFDAVYWFENLRKPVLFSQTINSLMLKGHSVFIEIGPHPVLLGAIQQSIGNNSDEIHLLPTLKREEPKIDTILKTVGVLYTLGFKINWDQFYGKKCAYVKLPPIGWNHDRYWLDQRTNLGNTISFYENGHPLLGGALSLSYSPADRLWQNVLNTDILPYLLDHKIDDEVVLPAAAYMEMAFEVMQQMNLSETHELTNFTFIESMRFPEGKNIDLQVALIPKENNSYNFSVYSKKENEANWYLHSTATLSPNVYDSFKISNIQDNQSFCDKEPDINSKDFYDSIHRRGLHYGESFKGVQKIWFHSNGIRAYVKLGESQKFDGNHYQFHPVLLDACLQVIAAADNNSDNNDRYLPYSCSKLVFKGGFSDEVWCNVTLIGNSKTEDDTIEADIAIYDNKENLVAYLKGFTLRRFRNFKPDDIFKNQTWFYKTKWEKQDLQQVPSEPQNSTRFWLLFADNQGYGDNLKELLEKQGDECTIVYADDLLNSLNRDPNNGLNTLLERIMQVSNSILYGIVHLWSLSIPAIENSEKSFIKLYNLGCNSIMRLVQSLSVHYKGSPHLWLVINGVQSINLAHQISVEQATSWGLGKVISFEFPELKCTRIDLDPKSSIENAVVQLGKHLYIETNEDQIAFRDGKGYVPRLVPVALKPIHILDKKIKSNGTYVITGGFGALGLETAKWLINKGARYLVLFSRNKPTEKTVFEIDELRKLGATISVQRIDVSNFNEVQSLFGEVAKKLPPIKGIVHAAGVLDDASILDLDESQMKRVMSPKVEGTWNLHYNSLNLNLDFFIMYSSAVSVLGSPGQGNYAAGSSFLDAMAYYRKNMGLPALSINWGPWAEVGLAAQASEKMEEQNISTEHLVKMIEVDQGFKVLEALMDQSFSQITALPFDLKNLLELYPLAASMPFFKEIRGDNNYSAKLYARPNLRQAYVAPRNEIEHKMVELWQQTLHIDKVGVQDSFFELGGDSVLAAQIISSARKTYGIDIDPKEAFQYFTIERISELVEVEILKQIESMSEEEVRNHLSKEE
ncbi:type I polyketide synthase [Aegicerativicinus sediminis]|uniref:type I polyketide synthase n=1 Tax=Aegicerativicinus sediminis TaxID=2893202 RepID=UPI001E2CB8D1|nr:type I polyketide synthase [Aegicerativicinus sediminis]